MIWKISVIGFIVGLSALFFFGLGNDPKLIPSPLKGKSAPLFQAETVSGEAFSSEALQGKVALITFWASWCTTCKADEPLINSLRTRYKERDDFVVVGVGTQDTHGNIQSHLAKGGRPYLNLYDGKGRIAIDFGVYGVPETYLLDKDGTIKEKMVGPINAKKLNELIRALLAGETAG